MATSLRGYNREAEAKKINSLFSKYSFRVYILQTAVQQHNNIANSRNRRVLKEEKYVNYISAK